MTGDELFTVSVVADGPDKVSIRSDRTSVQTYTAPGRNVQAPGVTPPESPAEEQDDPENLCDTIEIENHPDCGHQEALLCKEEEEHVTPLARRDCPSIGAESSESGSGLVVLETSVKSELKDDYEYYPSSRTIRECNANQCFYLDAKIEESGYYPATDVKEEDLPYPSTHIGYSPSESIASEHEFSSADRSLATESKLSASRFSKHPSPRSSDGESTVVNDDGDVGDGDGDDTEEYESWPPGGGESRGVEGEIHEKEDQCASGSDMDIFGDSSDGFQAPQPKPRKQHRRTSQDETSSSPEREAGVSADRNKFKRNYKRWLRSDEDYRKIKKKMKAGKSKKDSWLTAFDVFRQLNGPAWQPVVRLQRIEAPAPHNTKAQVGEQDSTVLAEQIDTTGGASEAGSSEADTVRTNDFGPERRTDRIDSEEASSEDRPHKEASQEESANNTDIETTQDNPSSKGRKSNSSVIPQSSGGEEEYELQIREVVMRGKHFFKCCTCEKLFYTREFILKHLKKRKDHAKMSSKRSSTESRENDDGQKISESKGNSKGNAVARLKGSHFLLEKAMREKGGSRLVQMVIDHTKEREHRQRKLRANVAKKSTGGKVHKHVESAKPDPKTKTPTQLSEAKKAKLALPDRPKRAETPFNEKIQTKERRNSGQRYSLDSAPSEKAAAKKVKPALSDRQPRAEMPIREGGKTKAPSDTPRTSSQKSAPVEKTAASCVQGRVGHVQRSAAKAACKSFYPPTLVIRDRKVGWRPRHWVQQMAAMQQAQNSRAGAKKTKARRDSRRSSSSSSQRGLRSSDHGQKRTGDNTEEEAEQTTDCEEREQDKQRRGSQDKIPSNKHRINSDRSQGQAEKNLDDIINRVAAYTPDSQTHEEEEQEKVSQDKNRSLQHNNNTEKERMITDTPIVSPTEGATAEEGPTTRAEGTKAKITPSMTPENNLTSILGTTKGRKLELRVQLNKLDLPFNYRKLSSANGLSVKRRRRKKLINNGSKPFVCDVCQRAFRDGSKMRTHQQEVHMERRPFRCKVCGFRMKRPGHLKRHLLTHAKNQLYECDKCPRRFAQACYLAAHKYVHVTERPHACVTCGLRFVTVTQLVRHERRVHRDVRSYKCGVCQQAHKTRFELNIHLASHANEKKSENKENESEATAVSKAPETTSNKAPEKQDGASLDRSRRRLAQKRKHETGNAKKNSTVVDNLRSRSPKMAVEVPEKTVRTKPPSCEPADSDKTPVAARGGERWYHCQDCEKRFETEAGLRGHRIREPHRDPARERQSHRNLVRERPYACKYCGNRYRHSSSLLTHSRTHNQNNMIRCKTCGRRFTTAWNLRQHERTHSGERPYGCKECPRAFRSFDNLAGHMSLHTGDKPYPCDLCDQRFRLRKMLIGHKVNAHGEPHPFNCHVCQKGFVRTYALTLHMRIHSGEKPHPCDECGKAFRTPTQLYTHKERHGFERNFSCNLCKRHFRCAETLKRHKLIHKAASHRCPFCDERVSGKRNFRQHLRRHMVRQRPLPPTPAERPTLRSSSTRKPADPDSRHECPTCGKVFDSRKAVLRHVETHSKLRPFVCQETGCNGRFRTKAVLSRHMLIHTGEKPYRCRCGMPFRYGHALKKHSAKCQREDGEVEYT